MITVYKTDGTQVELPKAPTLKEAQAIVGGYVERVCPRKSPGIVMLVDEEGLLKHYPPNLKGTLLYGDPIVGDVIVMDRESAKPWLDGN